LNVKNLEEKLIELSDKQLHRPIICHSFDNGLFHLVTYVSITLNCYSQVANEGNSRIADTNKKLEGKPGISVGTIFPNILSSYIIPELFSFSLVASWGLLEEFLHDVLFWVISNNIKTIKPVKYSKVRKVSIDSNQLVAKMLDPRTRSIAETIKIYKKLFGINLHKNKDFIALEKLRHRRNKIAHTGKLLGYYSPTRELISEDDDFEKQLSIIERKSWSDYTDVKTTYDEKKRLALHITEYPFDPTQTRTSMTLEDDFCSTITHMWNLCDFLTEKIFIQTKKP